SSSCGGPTFAAQRRLPSAWLSAMTCWAPSRSPMVKMRPPATDRLEKPPPRPVVSQASGGPGAFHSESRPVSDETASRLGPRHPGHSAAAARARGWLARASIPAGRSARAPRVRHLHMVVDSRCPRREYFPSEGRGMRRAGHRAKPPQRARRHADEALEGAAERCLRFVAETPGNLGDAQPLLA